MAQVEASFCTAKHIAILMQDRRNWGAGRALVHPHFGRLVNPTPTMGADYTLPPPDFRTFHRMLMIYEFGAQKVMSQ